MLATLSPATTHRLMAHNSKEDTHYGGPELLGYYLESSNDRRHYRNALVIDPFANKIPLHFSLSFALFYRAR